MFCVPRSTRRALLAALYVPRSTRRALRAVLYAAHSTRRALHAALYVLRCTRRALRAKRRALQGGPLYLKPPKNSMKRLNAFILTRSAFHS